jgi:hypothetical protein
MKKNLLLVFLAFSFVFIFSGQCLAQVNEYSLIPVDLEVGPGDSIVQVNVNIKTVYSRVEALVLPLFAEGTCNPVLDTVLTGGLSDANPPAFDSPSLADHFIQRIVNPYGPPVDPMLFDVVTTDGGVLYPSEGLFCRMFFKVSGPGTLTFRTAIHPTAGPVAMYSFSLGSLPVNWPAAGEVGSFNVVPRVNKYYLVPVNLNIYPSGGTVEIDINMQLFEEYSSIKFFVVPLFAEGTSNPVLDTVLTGGLSNPCPPGFFPPSLIGCDWVWGLTVDPYGPPVNPILFAAALSGPGVFPPANGLYCKMFYHVSGPGTLTFRTAVHSTAGSVCMQRNDGVYALINWQPAEEVGSFNVMAFQPGDANRDGKINITDVIYLINYLFKSGYPPYPSIAGDANCDGNVTVADVVYLINYLFKGGPPPPC